MVNKSGGGKVVMEIDGCRGQCTGDCEIYMTGEVSVSGVGEH